jgi:hypothetical protein
MRSNVSVAALTKIFAEEITIQQATIYLDKIAGALWEEKRISAFFEDAGQQLREAWVGVKFGELIGCTHIQLAPKAQEGFDVFLRHERGVLKYDVTEAMDRNRDRPSEFAEIKGAGSESDNEMSFQESEFFRVVGNRLKRKQDPQKRVVIYVNTGWLPEDPEIEPALQRWHESFRSRYRSIHLLLRSGLIELGPNFREIGNWRRG